jgi:hypothetical protein
MLAVGAVLVPRATRADDAVASSPSLRHRVDAGFSFGMRHVNLEHTRSERLGMDQASLGAKIAYGYRISEGFEIGAGGGYWNGPELNGFAARLTARPVFPIGDDKEVGATVSAGLLLWPHAEPKTPSETETAVWTGPMFSLGGDFTYWVARGFGPQVFVEAAAGRVNGQNIRPNATWFLAIGAGIGCAGRF